MAKKHLQELLNEEQEPFVLTNYINERCSQLRKSPPKTQLHLKRRKPISQNPISPCNFRKNACFFPSRAIKNSPLFDFQSTPTNPFLKAAQKSKTPKNLSFGLLGSILKIISPRKKPQKRKICVEEIRVSVRDILRWDSFDGLQTFSEEKSGEALEMGENRISEVGFSCSCESSGWSEDFEGKSMDLEIWSNESRSSCCRALDLEETEGGSGHCEKAFCSSPLRFQGLEMVSDSGHKTPEFSSPAMTPSRRKTEIPGSTLFPCTGGNESASSSHKELEEEEKEQFSPVSVLDAPFDDDDEDSPEEAEGDEDDENFEHTFAAVQRAKNQLLNKIQRFERLVDLDPVELEKRIAEAELEEAEAEAEEKCTEEESVINETVEELVRLVLSRSDGYLQPKRIPADMKRLVLDLAEEERGDDDMMDVEVVTKKVAERIELWKDVEPHTIDMMVGLDFRREDNEWRRNIGESREVAVQIEFAIFGLLVHELTVDLARSNHH
ncbi:uncharacterized protein LOC131234816 [Magnolia sinica]|uniref:uncharacterized protein LOC131234816 n=1 Tax=Magnolia sinica TaxID=86752 RepID=UPI00265A67DC|nr:uncharacterized protein LOC131234816 [Magnolia sinica]